MKKKGIIILAALLVIAMTACGLCESLFVDNRETDKIYPERLNMRSMPSKEGAIIGLYYTGAEVENLGQENEEFTKVSIGGITGYMATEYLITAEEAVSRYGEDSGFGDCRAAQVDLSGMWQQTLPLHETTDLTSKRLGEVENGAMVSLVAVLDTWAYIRAQIDGKDVLGYVPLDALTDVGELKVCIIAGAKADSKTYLYDAPNNKAEPIMVLKNGTACFNLFGRKEGEWRRVRVGGISGWIKYTQTASLFDLGDQPRSIVPYYPLQMKAKKDIILYKDTQSSADGTMTLGKDMPVEILAEQEEYVYVRTLVGGAGAYDSGDFGYVKISDLSLMESEAGVGVAQIDDGDLPSILMSKPEDEAEIVGVLCSGAQVRIVDYTQTNYVHVMLGAVEGYIKKDEIRLLTYEGAPISQKIPQRAKVVKDAVLRERPASGAKGGTTAAKDSRVYMLGHFGDWAYVQYADKVGLDVANAEQDNTGFVPLSSLSAPASTTHLIATLNGDNVNLRSDSSSTTGQIIGRAHIGDRVRVADYGVEWTKIETPDGKLGYVKTDFLTFE